jgi:glycosyltransferase involved in cell wall biosynthesis
MRERSVVWIVPDRLPPKPFSGAVRRLAALRCDRALCLSRYIADDLTAGSPALERLVEVVPPGVATTTEGPGAGPAHNGRRAVIVGHISPTKRTDLAVEIARLVLMEEPEFELEIIGAAQFRDEDFALERDLRAAVAADPVLSSNVRFAGRDPDVAQRLREAAMLLHCRPDEPFGMVLIEAMAAGIPVVAPASGGPAEIVTDGQTGLLYPAGDAQAAAKQVLRLLRDPQLARRIGTAAAERATTRYSFDRQVADSRRLLAELA